MSKKSIKPAEPPPSCPPVGKLCGRVPASVGMTALVRTLWDLRMVNAAIAQSSNPITDYKSMVCIFLFGGNDANNMLIPTNSSTYSQYSSTRGALALPQSALTATALNPSTSDGNTYSLHSSMPELAGLFNQGKAALLPNVGTLVAQINRQAVSEPLGRRPAAVVQSQRPADPVADLGARQTECDRLGRPHVRPAQRQRQPQHRGLDEHFVVGAEHLRGRHSVSPYNVGTSSAITLNFPTSGTGPPSCRR